MSWPLRLVFLRGYEIVTMFRFPSTFPSPARAVRPIPAGEVKRRGMTLVELLVGMAIATLMTIAGWRAIEALQTARDQTFRDATQWQALDNLFATLEADLRRADLRSFSGDATSLTFRLNPLTPTDPARVVLYRWLATDNGLARAIRQSDDGSIAMVEAKNARFAYRQSPTRAEPNPTSTPQINEYPRAVELAIELAGNDADASRVVNRVVVLR
jgi:prepilin-type N-terminal cleavage/methylation domain-containing protein